MKIELRKFKHYPRLSEETNAFSADVYVDGILIAWAANDGRGGENRLDVAEPKHRAKVSEMHTWAMQQPAHEGLSMNLDFYISLMVDEKINEKVYAKNRKVFDQYTDTQLMGILVYNQKESIIEGEFKRTETIAYMAKEASHGRIKLPSQRSLQPK